MMILTLIYSMFYYKTRLFSEPYTCMQMISFAQSTIWSSSLIKTITALYIRVFLCLSSKRWVFLKKSTKTWNFPFDPQITLSYRIKSPSCHPSVFVEYSVMYTEKVIPPPFLLFFAPFLYNKYFKRIKERQQEET